MDEHRIGFLLSDVSRLMRYRFDGKARTIGVTRPQWRLLTLISRNPGVSQAALADLLEVERITLCRMVDRLEEAGLAERRPDPADRRVWRIFLTEKGNGIVKKLAVIGDAFQEEMLAALEPGEAERLLESLNKLREALSKRAEDANVA